MLMYKSGTGTHQVMSSAVDTVSQWYRDTSGHVFCSGYCFPVVQGHIRLCLLQWILFPSGTGTHQVMSSAVDTVSQWYRDTSGYVFCSGYCFPVVQGHIRLCLLQWILFPSGTGTHQVMSSAVDTVSQWYRDTSGYVFCSGYCFPVVQGHIRLCLLQWILFPSGTGTHQVMSSAVDTVSQWYRDTSGYVFCSGYCFRRMMGR